MPCVEFVIVAKFWPNSLYGKYLHKDYDVKDDKFKIGTELNETIVQKFLENEINEISISSTNSISKGPYLLQTVYNDKNETKNILRRLKKARKHYEATGKIILETD